MLIGFNSLNRVLNNTPPAGGVVTINSEDDLEAHQMDLHIKLANWGDATTRKLVGEWAIIQNYADVSDGINSIPQAEKDNWVDLGKKIHTIWNDNGIGRAHWSIGRHWGDYALAAYFWNTGTQTFDPMYSATDLMESTDYAGRTNLATEDYDVAINIAGAEFGYSPRADYPSTKQTDSSGIFTNSWQSYGARYPIAVPDLQFLTTTGYNIVRTPVRLEKFFSAHDSTTPNATEVTALRSSITDAAAEGVEFMLDFHNYACFIEGDTNSKKNFVWGTATTKNEVVVHIHTREVTPGVFEDDAVISWEDDGSTYKILKDSVEIADLGAGVTDYTDVDMTGTPTYELRKNDTTNVTALYEDTGFFGDWTKQQYAAQVVAVWQEIDDLAATIHLDLMNEPSQVDASGAVTLERPNNESVSFGRLDSVNREYTQEVVDELELAGFTGDYYVPFPNWSGMEALNEGSFAGPWITGVPASRVVYEPHSYWDQFYNGFGNQNQNYDSAVIGVGSHSPQSYTTSV